MFWLGTIGAALAAAAAQFWVPESPERKPGRVDLRGAALLATGLVMPLVAISRANVWGWGSGRTLGLIAAGLVVLAAWVVVERRTDEPLADIPTLMKRPVLLTNVATLLVGFGMFGSFLLIPQLVEAPVSSGYGFGLGATGAGLLLVPGSLLMLFAGPLSGTLGTRLGSKVPLALGAAVTAVGLLLLAFEHSIRLSVAGGAFVLFGGIGLAFAAMPNLIVEAVPPEQTGEATGFNALLRSVGGARRHCTDRAMTAAISADVVLPELTAARASLWSAVERLMDSAKAQGRMLAGVRSADLRVLWAGVARMLVADGVEDPAVWRHYATLVANALRADDVAAIGLAG